MIRRAAFVLLAAHGPAALQAQGLSYEGELSLATGTYIFAERTTSWALSSGLAATSGPFTLRATVPVYLQNTSLVALSGPGGRLPTGGSSSGAVADSGSARKGRQGGAGSRTGMAAARTGTGPVEVPGSAVTGYSTAVGDPSGQLAWRAIERGDLVLALSAMAKAPVADTATFGTGEWDVGAGLSASHRLGRTMAVGLDLTYWRIGDMPTLDFRDPVSASVGVAYLAGAKWGGGLSVTAATSALDGYDGPAWVSGYVQRVSPGAGWGVSGALGLTETTSDLAVGLFWRIRLLSGS